MKQSMEQRLLAILHIEDIHRGHANLPSRVKNPLDTYIRCAVFSATSLAAQGWGLTLITNEAGLVTQRVDVLGLTAVAPEIVGRTFRLDVPVGIPFRGAHFKLELIDAIANSEFGAETGIIDIDTVTIAPIRLPELSGSEILACDVTPAPQSAEADARVRRDIARLTGVNLPAPRWYGGEFVFGRAEAFRRLAETIGAAWPSYRREIRTYHHLSDEMVLNAALQGTPGLTAVDARRSAVIQRWSSARTDTPQMSFAEARRASILHLLSDKDFLADRAGLPFSPGNFVTDYSKMAVRKLVIRRFYNAVAPLLGKQRKYVARLR